MFKGLVILAIVISPFLASRNMTIFGNSTLGYYYLEAYVGTPPQKKSLIIDTGSHLTIFPCTGCGKCRNHIYKIFNQKDSKTFKTVDPKKKYFGWKCSNKSSKYLCRFTQGYTEGSEYSGYYGIDNFLFENELNGENLKNHKHIFGCAMTETGEFYTQEADGIIGIGVAQTTKTPNPPTILDVELMEKRIDKQTFSICIARNGGEMSLGDWNRYLHLPHSKVRTLNSEDLKWTEQYNVHISDIQIGGKSIDHNFENLNKNGGKAFLDTGTTFVYFGPELFSKFVSYITGFCADKTHNCGGSDMYEECYFYNKKLYKGVDEFFNTFPKISFKFNKDVEWDWFPQDYLVEALDSTSHYCIGVKSLKDIILGAVFMRNYDIHFDKVKKRVSFVRSNCGKIDGFIPSSDDDTVRVHPSKAKNATPTLSKEPVPIITTTEVKQEVVNPNQLDDLDKNDKDIKIKPDNHGIEVPQASQAEQAPNQAKPHSKKPHKTLYNALYLLLGMFALCVVIVSLRFLM